MKRVATESARVLQLLPPDEIRPLRGFDLPSLFQKVGARYGFLKTPTSIEGFTQPTGAKFENGRFTSPQFLGETPIAELSLFVDGLIVTCADTELASLLIDEVLAWLISIEAIRAPITNRPRTYTSNVIVQFDKIPPENFSRGLRIASLLDAALAEEHGSEMFTSLERLGFSVDPHSPSQPKLGPFIIERRKNVAYDQNYFWSTAPLKLTSHFNLLEALENELAQSLAGQGSA